MQDTLGKMPGANVFVQDIIEERPEKEGDQGWTILAPNKRFNGVVNKRDFARGRTVVYHEETAREFETIYGYAVEPALPPAPPRKRNPRKPRTYVRA